MFFTVFLLFMGSHVTWCNKTRSEIVNELFDAKQYDHTTRPGEDEGRSTRIELSVVVRKVSEVDTKKMQMTMQITLRKKWTDQRLEYSAFDYPNSSYISLAATQQIWKPDLQFQNEVSGIRHGIVAENSYIRLFPDGTVLTSERLTIVLRCPMNIAYFPFDSQSCPLQIASYGSTREEIIYFWKTPNHPVQFAQNLFLPNFELQDSYPGDCEFLTTGGRHSCAEVTFLLKRSATPLVLSVMVPSLMWVLVAWLALCVPIHRDHLPGRLLLISTSLLALSCIYTQVQSGLPKVAYLKAIDIWLGTCVFFVFITLLEVTVVSLTEKKRLNLVFMILNPILFSLLFFLPFVVVYSISS